MSEKMLSFVSIGTCNQFEEDSLRSEVPRNTNPKFPAKFLKLSPWRPKKDCGDFLAKNHPGL